MIIAVTGGTGFIGRRIVQRHLDAGDTVRLLTRRSSDEIRVGGSIGLFTADLADEKADFRPFVDGADILYHCAGEIRDPSRMRLIHVNGTRRLLEAADGRIGRWVQLSSVGAYGPCDSGIVNEETPLKPCGTYEQSKTESDRLVIAAGESVALPYSILRPSIVFGPDMTNRSLFQMISMINRRVFFFVGKRGVSANNIHVENVVEALHRCATLYQARGRIYNVSDWRSMEDFVGAIADELGRPRPRIRLPELPVRLATHLLGRIPHFPLTDARVKALANRTKYASERIRQELSYEHPVSMEEGLRQLVAAWRDQFANA